MLQWSSSSEGYYEHYFYDGTEAAITEIKFRGCRNINIACSCKQRYIRVNGEWIAYQHGFKATGWFAKTRI